MSGRPKKYQNPETKTSKTIQQSSSTRLELEKEKWLHDSSIQIIDESLKEIAKLQKLEELSLRRT